MEVQLKRLKIGDIIKPIHSCDSDLNDFLMEDALPHIEDQQGVTYLFENEKETICYCTILHDKISLRDSDKKHWNSLTGHIQRNRRSNYPAIKIGKLATSLNFERQGYGRRLISLVQYLYTKSDLAAGCRFITVDAVNEPSQKAITFYKNIGFHFMTDNDEHDETRYMAFDLLSMKI